MTVAPSYVAVKRKREEAPIQSLILEEHRTKHARVNVEYKLKSVSQPSNEPPPKTAGPKSDQDVTDAPKAAPNKTPFVKKTDTLAHQAVKNSGPRHFELATGKRNADTAGLLPTFIERPLKRSNVDLDSEPEHKSTPLKRPGTKSTQKGGANGTPDLKALGRIEPSAALSAKLSALAFEETGEAAPKPRVIAQPKPTARRRKEPPPPSATESPRPGPSETLLPPSTSMDFSDDDYVYDIYIRSTTTPQSIPPPPAPAFTSPSAPLYPVPTDSTAPRSLTGLPSDLSSFASFSSHHADPNVGYLILPDSSESSYFWSSDPTATKPVAGAGSDSDDEGDDEDSNAEDFYANEYPDDEVDGEDEMGRGAYGFRHGRGSEDEDEYGDVGGWGGRRGSEGSDSDDDDEDDGAGENPWKKIMGAERRRTGL